MLTLTSDNLVSLGAVAVDPALLRVGRGVLYTSLENVILLWAIYHRPYGLQ